MSCGVVTGRAYPRAVNDASPGSAGDATRNADPDRPTAGICEIHDPEMMDPHVHGVVVQQSEELEVGREVGLDLLQPLTA